MATTVDNSPWMEWIASLVGERPRHTETAAFPPDRYLCLLNELPLHLLPRRARGLLQIETDKTPRLIFNPNCELRAAEDLPADISGPEALRSAFALPGTIAWVYDRERQSRMPFWLGSRFEPVLQELRNGSTTSASLPQDVGAVLVAAGILVPEEADTRAGNECDEAFRSAAHMFREKGYAPLPGLIHPFHVAALRRYYRHLIRKGRIQLGDSQSSLRYVVHDEPVARFFHHQIAGAFGKVIGEPIKPSYVYLASYIAGAELEKHVDREQCEFSITLCLDFSPEPDLASPWPICLDTGSGTVKVHQALGDGLAYRGTKLPHYRDKLPEGQTSTSIFFHYVHESFCGPLN